MGLGRTETGEHRWDANSYSWVTLAPTTFPPTPVRQPDGAYRSRRLGDPLAPHSKPDSPPHPRAIAEGSGTILIDGKPAALTGHAVGCGGVVIGSASGEGS